MFRKILLLFLAFTVLATCGCSASRKNEVDYFETSFYPESDFGNPVIEYCHFTMERTETDAKCSADGILISGESFDVSFSAPIEAFDELQEILEEDELEYLDGFHYESDPPKTGEGGSLYIKYARGKDFSTSDDSVIPFFLLATPFCTFFADLAEDAGVPFLPEGDEIVGIEFCHGGTMANDFFTYSAVLGENETRITAEMISDAVELSLDAAVMDELRQIVAEHGMEEWAGFDESDYDVLDGEWFDLSITYANGVRITASGNNAFPAGYTDASAALRAAFEKYLPLQEY